MKKTKETANAMHAEGTKFIVNGGKREDHDFSVGDIVTLIRNDGSGVFKYKRVTDGQESWGKNEFFTVCENKKKVLLNRFILRYELNGTTFKMFATLADTRKHIAELVGNPDLNRESIVVYDIKKTMAVKLSTAISIK